MKRLFVFSLQARIMPLKVSDELSFLNKTLMFNPVTHPTDGRFALSFSAYITSVNVIQMSARLNVGSEMIAILTVPLWLAVKDLLLVVSMMTGGMLYRLWKRSRLPKSWLEVAELMSHVWVPSSGDEREAMCVAVLIPCDSSCMEATMIISLTGLPVWAIATKGGT